MEKVQNNQGLWGHKEMGVSSGLTWECKNVEFNAKQYGDTFKK